jgi:hypothetical protein
MKVKLMKLTAIFVPMLLLAPTVQAQTVGTPVNQAQVAPAPASLEVQNLYAVGGSYNIGATPAVSGTALYARRINTDGTYAFTVLDALPNTVRPFTVSTNVGAGIAQKVATIGKVPIYSPLTAGFSWTGKNLGWQWSGGALVSIHIKHQWYLLPNVRFLKSSVSGGTGYQIITGVFVGWGQ